MEQQETLVFGSEAERLDAMESLGESQDDLAKLEQIRNAQIVAQEEGQGPEVAPQGTEAVQEPAAAAQQPAAPPVSEPAAAVSEPFTINPEAIRAAGLTYPNAEELIKGTVEKERYIQHQKELAETSKQRIAELEAELARARTQPPAQTAQPPAQSPQTATGAIESARGTVANIKAQLAELKRIKEADPYAASTSEDFQERQWQLQEAYSEALMHLTDLTTQTVGGFEAQRQAAAQEAERQRVAAEAEQRRKAFVDDLAEMDAVSADAEFSELRMSKPAVEVDKDFANWRMDVAAVFYGRPAATGAEINAALDQLQARNPDLIHKLSARGVPAVPTQDMRNYIMLSHALDYRDGWVPDPARPGEDMRATRYDAASGKMVPVVMPSLKDALKQKRLNEGYYKQQVNQAYQRGAESFAQAQAKRGPEVPELNSPSTMGSSGVSDADWAAKVITECDEFEVMRQYRAGNRKMLDELNEARRICGMEPITFT